MRVTANLVVVGIFGLLGAPALGCSPEGATRAEHEQVGQSFEAMGGCNRCNNCVQYARCQQPALPHGLWSYEDKLNIMNSQDAVPGAVAVIDVGDATGHVAYVESASGDAITISEGNYPYGHCGTRTGTRETLRIQGYFVP